MNPAQTLAHWRLWSDVCKTLGWRMEKGRLQSRPVAELGLFAARVWDQAATAAWADARAATVDDLRHALYFLACGQVSSSRVKSNAACTRVIGWMLLCIDDTNLVGVEKAGLKEGQADADARLARIAALRSWHPDEYLDAICRDRFAGRYERPHWEMLPAADIRALYLDLRARRRDEPF